MNITDVFKFLSPFHDVKDKLADDKAKGVSPALDSAFIFSLLRLVSVGALVFFGVTISPEQMNTLSTNIPILIAAAMAVYAEIMKISAAYFATKKLAVTNAQVDSNQAAITAGCDKQAA